MAYLEPEAYSDHCQTSTMQCFEKVATGAFKKVLIFSRDGTFLL